MKDWYRFTLHPVVIIALAIGPTWAQTERSAGGQAFLSQKPLSQKQRTVALMSGRVMLSLAQRFGITHIQGKNVLRASVPSKEGRPHVLLADRAVGADPAFHENEPSLAVRPNNRNILVAASHLLGHPSGKCGAFRSLNGGASWTGPVLLPLRFSSDFCSDPVVRYAPDSSLVYASYLSVRENASTSDLMVTRSVNNGLTWATAKIAIAGGDLDGDGLLDFVDKPWIDVHTFPTRADASSRLYVTATLFAGSGDFHILFARSTNHGATFSSPRALSSAFQGSGMVLQGSRPQGGRDRDLLVCWYNSESDGFGPERGGGGVFDIRCRASADFGSTFGPEVAAVDNMSFELPFFLGPLVGSIPAYHRWWGGMFPSLALTEDGTAHIVFAADPRRGQSATSAEDGDIYYVRSPRPYLSWTPPVRISQDTRAKAQGYPTVTAKKINGGSILSVFWEDHRNSVRNNELYDIYADSTWPSFGQDLRISDLSSFSDFLFIGDYIDSGTSKVPGDLSAHVIWTDRSDKTSRLDLEDDIYEDRLEFLAGPPGGSFP